MIHAFDTRAMMSPRCHACQAALAPLERKYHRIVCYTCVATESYVLGGPVKERRFFSCMKTQSSRRALHFALPAVRPCL